MKKIKGGMKIKAPDIFRDTSRRQRAKRLLHVETKKMDCGHGFREPSCLGSIVGKDSKHVVV